MSLRFHMHSCMNGWGGRHSLLRLAVSAMLVSNVSVAFATIALPGPFPFDTTVQLPNDRHAQWDTAVVTRYTLRLLYWEVCIEATNPGCAGWLQACTFGSHDSLIQCVSLPDSFMPLFDQRLCRDTSTPCVPKVTMNNTRMYFSVPTGLGTLFMRITAIDLDTATADIRSLSLSFDTLRPTARIHDAGSRSPAAHKPHALRESIAYDFQGRSLPQSRGPRHMIVLHPHSGRSGHGLTIIRP
jgi:hypothetical protein